MERIEPTPVLVVGAGPTGLVTALTLAVNGVPSRVIDRQASAVTSSRALGCQPRSMEILAALDVVGSILEISEPLHGSSIMRGTEELADVRWIPPDAPYPYTYVFPESGLERILRDRLAELGVTIEWNTELVGLEHRESDVVATLADGRRLLTQWVVGCDGAHSQTRAAADIAFEGRATGEVHYLADVSFEPRDPRPGPAMWLAPDGPLMLMRMPGSAGVWRIFVDVTDWTGRNELPVPTVDILQALLDRRAIGPGHIKIRQVHWTSTYRTSLRLAASYRRQRLFIAGDAAHVFPPYGGQGMNTGIQDAYNLAWKLARVVQAKSSVTILDTYECERRPVAVDTIRDVDRRRRLFALRNPIARVIRDLALRVTLRSDRANRAGSYATSELGISYRGRSWLCVDDGSQAEPRAGDRAPDGQLGKKRLFAVFRPTCFTLLVFSGRYTPAALPPDVPPELNVVAINECTDPGLSLTERYSAKGGALVLVRPDGHIGFRGGAHSHAALRAYLDRVTLPGPKP